MKLILLVSISRKYFKIFKNIKLVIIKYGYLKKTVINAEESHR